MRRIQDDLPIFKKDEQSGFLVFTRNDEKLANGKKFGER